MKTFDEIIAREELKKADLSKLDALRKQRHLCDKIFTGVLYHGFQISDTEENFVWRCNRSLRPIAREELIALQKITARRWAERELG